MSEKEEYIGSKQESKKKPFDMSILDKPHQVDTVILGKSKAMVKKQKVYA